MLVLAIKAGVSGGGRKYDSSTKACVGGYLKAQFLHVIQKPISFASLTDNFTLLFSKLFKLILNANTANMEQLFGPEKLSELSRNWPLVVKSLRPPRTWTSSEYKWLNVDVQLTRFLFVVLEKNTLAVTSSKGGWFYWMSAEPTTCNFDVSKCEFPLHGLGDLTDWTYGFLRVRIFIGEGRSQSGGRW